MRPGSLLAASCAVLALQLSPALAADYDPPIFIEEAPEWVPVEIGSGWYLRGDISHSFKSSYRDSAISVDDGLFDNNLLGPGWLGPVDFFSYREKKSPVQGSIGVGYHFNDYLRGDLTVGLLENQKHEASAHVSTAYLNPLRFIDSMDIANIATPDVGCLGSRTTTVTETDADGNSQVVSSNTDADWRNDCMVYAQSKQSAWNGMANAYLDLGTFSGFTPYIGGGIGVLYTSNKISADSDCRNETATTTTQNGTTTRETVVAFNCRNGEGRAETASYHQTKYNLMYALSAGVAYQLTQNTKLDVGYQYLAAPSLRSYTVSENGIHQRKGFNQHQVKVGLRYDLW